MTQTGSRLSVRLSWVTLRWKHLELTTHATGSPSPRHPHTHTQMFSCVLFGEMTIPSVSFGEQREEFPKSTDAGCVRLLLRRQRCKQASFVLEICCILCGGQAVRCFQKKYISALIFKSTLISVDLLQRSTLIMRYG